MKNLSNAMRILLRDVATDDDAIRSNPRTKTAQALARRGLVSLAGEVPTLTPDGTMVALAYGWVEAEPEPAVEAALNRALDEPTVLPTPRLDADADGHPVTVLADGRAVRLRAKADQTDKILLEHHVLTHLPAAGFSELFRAWLDEHGIDPESLKGDRAAYRAQYLPVWNAGRRLVHAGIVTIDIAGKTWTNMQLADPIPAEYAGEVTS